MVSRNGGAEAPLYRYRFGAVEFDESRFELGVGGLTVDLEQKPLQVLAALLRHADEVVTKAELFETVWAGRITVDNVLANAVLKLRKACGDADAGRIVTVPRVGYRLTGPVERIAVGLRLSSRLDLKAGAAVPGREHFILQSQVSGSRGSEVWLARHEKTREARIYKFSPDGEGLGALKREATIHRLLVRSLGERADFVRIIDWNFETAPFYLECEYGGCDLAVWADADCHLGTQSADERIRLFLQIADALSAAHRVGVLHKDLKPANILIAPKGDGWQIRVADFGSGRLLEPGRLEELGITQLGLVVTQNVSADSTSGTPLYLAPELIAGHAPTVQSDLFALGLLLYQIVVADLKRTMAPGWERDIGNELLSEDIAAATDGDPTRRLASVAELTERLRGLEARRVQHERRQETERRAALAERELERSRTRRPWLIAVIASLTIGLAASLWLNHRANLARREAERETARAEATNRFLNSDLLGAVDPGGPGATANPTMREVLARAADRIDSRFANDPVSKASIELSLGKAYYALGDYAGAVTNERPAVELLRKAAGPEDASTLEAEYLLVQSLGYATRLDEAAALLARADRDAGERLKRNSMLALHADLARAQYQRLHQQIAQALSSLEAAERVRVAVDPDDDASLFSVHDGLADCYLRLGRTEDAARVLRDLIAPQFTSARIGATRWALVRLRYGAVLKEQEHYEESERVTVAAAEKLRAVLGEDHYFTGAALGQLADLYDRQGQFARAAELMKQAYAIVSKRLGEHGQATLIARANLGVLEYQSEQYDEALKTLFSTHDEFAQLFGLQSPQAQGVAFYLASALSDVGRQNDASQLAATLDPAALTSSAMGTGWAPRLQALKGQILLRTGRRQEALGLLEPAVAEMQKEGMQAWILAPFQKALMAARGMPKVSPEPASVALDPGL